MSRFKSHLRTFAARGLPRLRAVYWACSRYVWYYDGDQIFDARANGEFAFMRRTLPSATVVLDVGANRGDWTREALRLNPSLHVHAFEPSHATFRLLQANVGSDPRVTLNNVGVSSRPGDSRLWLFGEGEGINSMYQRGGLEYAGDKRQDASESIRMTTIDQYLAERDIRQVDLVKIDVEGHEIDVLLGARNAIEGGRVHAVQLEYGTTFIAARRFLKDVFDFFDALPFRLGKLTPRGVRWYERYDERLENFAYSNWIAVRSRVDA